MANDKRAVAFLDILGFKKMIDRIPLEKIVENYEKLINNSRGYSNWIGNNTESSIFTGADPKDMCKQSDSIILFANDSSEVSFLRLIIYAWRLLQFSIVTGLPIRGAISYGDIYINEDLNVFLGKGLLKAYQIEGKQNWIGVILDEIVEEQYSNIFGPKNTIFNNVMLKYNVPFKDGSYHNFRALNWRFNLIVKNGTRSLFKNEDNDQSVEAKILNTLEFARRIVSSGNIYATNIPIEFRSLWVGDSQPPFNHGDDL
ncbi:MAG: hypothetical protein ABFD18_05970 [Syntrophomonas sp.]